jgi:PAS domain S-box-containing protein
MDECFRIAFLGWREEARCLVEAWGEDARVRILGIVASPGDEETALLDLPIGLPNGLPSLAGVPPPVYLVDLRLGENDIPAGLPEAVTWIPFPASQLLIFLCGKHAPFRRYRGVLETARDAVVTIDESHRIVFFNRAAERMFGYDAGEVLGKDLNRIIPSAHRAKHREYVRRYVETRRGRFINHTVDLTAERRSGEEFPISISFSVAEENGRLLMTAVMRDTTEIKTLEQRALQNERLVSVGQALSYVTHEVKNPLVVIGGFARSLLRSEGIQGEDRRKLDIIGKEVQRMEGLLEEIQDFTKPLRLDRQKIRLVSFLREAMDLFSASETARYSRFSLDVQGDPCVLVDPDRLRQVILNLIKNAVEAVTGEGHVTVRAWEEGGAAYVEVEDTGEGIAPERREEVFQPFVTTKKGGTGLGLPLCRKIIRDHGGEIGICSEPGQGTRLKISLPISSGE